MITATEADKKAIEEAFSREIEIHTLMDLQGKSPTWISTKLRREEYVERWLRALCKIQPQLALKQQRIKANELREEASKLRRQFNVIKDMSDPIFLKNAIKDKLGIEIPNAMSLHEVGVFLLIEIASRLGKKKT